MHTVVADVLQQLGEGGENDLKRFIDHAAPLANSLAAIGQPAMAAAGWSRLSFAEFRTGFDPHETVMVIARDLLITFDVIDQRFGVAQRSHIEATEPRRGAVMQIAEYLRLLLNTDSRT